MRGVVAAAGKLWGLPLNVVVVGWLLLNIAVFLLMGYDKWMARRHFSRIPEECFFTAALAGGALGIVLGMLVFRHKTRKRSFQVIVAVATSIFLVAVWVVFVRGCSLC